MSKRKLVNTLKRKILKIFNEEKKESTDWQEKMRGELQRMAKLNGELILMMK